MSSSSTNQDEPSKGEAQLFVSATSAEIYRTVSELLSGSFAYEGSPISMPTLHPHGPIKQGGKLYNSRRIGIWAANDLKDIIARGDEDIAVIVQCTGAVRGAHAVTILSIEEAFPKGMAERDVPGIKDGLSGSAFDQGKVAKQAQVLLRDFASFLSLLAGRSVRDNEGEELNSHVEHCALVVAALRQIRFAAETTADGERRRLVKQLQAYVALSAVEHSLGKVAAGGLTSALAPYGMTSNLLWALTRSKLDVETRQIIPRKDISLNSEPTMMTFPIDLFVEFQGLFQQGKIDKDGNIFLEYAENRHVFQQVLAETLLRYWSSLQRLFTAKRALICHRKAEAAKRGNAGTKDSGDESNKLEDLVSTIVNAMGRVGKYTAMLKYLVVDQEKVMEAHVVWLCQAYGLYDTVLCPFDDKTDQWFQDSLAILNEHHPDDMPPRPLKPMDVALDASFGWANSAMSYLRSMIGQDQSLITLTNVSTRPHYGKIFATIVRTLPVFYITITVDPTDFPDPVAADQIASALQLSQSATTELREMMGGQGAARPRKVADHLDPGVVALTLFRRAAAAPAGLDPRLRLLVRGLNVYGLQVVSRAAVGLAELPLPSAPAPAPRRAPKGLVVPCRAALSVWTPCLLPAWALAEDADALLRRAGRELVMRLEASAAARRWVAGDS